MFGIVNSISSTSRTFSSTASPMRIERVLHGLARMLRRRQRATSHESFLVRMSKANVRGDICPVRSHGCAEQPVRGLGESRQRVPDISLKSRIRRFHDDKILESRDDREFARAWMRVYFRQFGARHLIARNAVG